MKNAQLAFPGDSFALTAIPMNQIKISNVLWKVYFCTEPRLKITFL
jgi:hypothetical protein